MEPLSPGGAVAPPKRGIKQILLSYFYWTSPRGSLQYDIMVTLILLFIFVTPHLWDYGDKPSTITGPTQPIQVVGNNGHGLIVTVQASDVQVAQGATDKEVKKALRKAIEPVTGDAVFVDRWETIPVVGAKPAWKVWAHR